VTLGVAKVDCHVLRLGKTTLGKSFAERGDHAKSLDGGAAAEKTDHRIHRLLRTRRERPCDRTAKQRDELAALHAGHGDFLPCRVASAQPGAPRQATTFGLPHAQPAAERAASPWARPESVLISVGARGCRSLPVLKTQQPWCAGARCNAGFATSRSVNATASAFRDRHARCVRGALNSYSSSKTSIHVHKHRFMYIGKL